MKTLPIAYQDERCQAEIIVAEANMLAGMRRTVLALEGQEAGETDTGRKVLRLFTYPALIAAAQSATLVLDGETVTWPVDFETFLSLPESLGSQWEKAVYELNPHWLLPGAEPEKKALIPGSQDSTSSLPKAKTTTSQKRRRSTT
jgi:hypothetical protein